ncbi:septum formation family protein [Leifsonia shinshuensis]|uniref:septum formation family protein n=1 Tax=Leifsonia shinshuensis TaxID=150026 RepID=UPI001F51344D|nr:septum formation family protein [Leifsonia shinshuensis]MCI0158017.1 septum formation family protein [Leifsonia shinshuensis]
MSGPRDWRPDGWDERTRQAHAAGGTFGRGLALSLLVVPLGVGAWLLLSQLGWMSSVIPFGVGILACLLFRYGSGGPVSTRGGVAVSIVVVGTVIAGVVVGHTAAAVRGYSGSDAGVAVLADPGFWRSFGDGYLTSPSMRQALFWNIGIGLLLGAIGTIPTLARHLTQLRVGQRLLLLVWPFVAAGAVVVVIAAVGLIGGRPSPAAATAQAPVVGECLDEDVRQDAVIDYGKTPIIVPCDEPHRAEVFYVGELTGEAVPAAYPGEEEVSRLATVQCSGPMAEFLGIAARPRS